MRSRSRDIPPSSGDSSDTPVRGRARSGAFYNAPPPVFNAQHEIIWAAGRTGPMSTTSAALDLASSHPLANETSPDIYSSSVPSSIHSSPSPSTSPFPDYSSPSTSPPSSQQQLQRRRDSSCDSSVPWPAHSALLRPSWPSCPYSSDMVLIFLHVVSKVFQIAVGCKLKPSARFHIAVADTIGKRPTMEDVVSVSGGFRDSPNEDVIAIFDGHHGRDVLKCFVNMKT